MSFVVTLALLIGLLVIVPLLAHLLRRGRAPTIPFVPTRFIPNVEHVAKSRNRLQDRLLLGVRAAIITLLALLGATPLLRCERAALTRNEGASIAAVFVLDDSGSMRARLQSGQSRFETATRIATDLLDQVREGDSVGLVLAGKPARLALLPTMNPQQLRQQLAAARQSDRPTDLATAIALAESALDRQPHVDKRVIVLSDLAGELPRLSPRVLVLGPELATPSRDCGVVSALRGVGRIQVELACTRELPGASAHLQLLDKNHRSLGERSVELRTGRATVPLESPRAGDAVELVLAIEDDNAGNDQSPVVDGSRGMVVATYSDPTTGRGTTGGPPILEQALRAIDPNLVIRPMTTVPEDIRELDQVGLFLLDDPPHFSAEARATLVGFAERGGIGAAFLGPSADAAQLGSLLLPFIERRAEWQTATPDGLDPRSFDALGEVAASLTDLAPRGRLVFDESHDPKVVIRGRWADQKPFWIERPVGRGLLMTFGLPAATSQSDLGLTTGFVAILEHILGASEHLGVSRVVTVGKSWRFPGLGPSELGSLAISGPSGAIHRAEGIPEDGATRVFVPPLVGRYSVTLAGRVEDRFAVYPADEILEEPRQAAVPATARPDRATGRLDLSRWVVLALLPLLLLELALGSASLRALLRKGRRIWGGEGRRPEHPW